MRLFLNTACNYGSGRSRLNKITDELSRRIGSFDVEEITSPDTIVTQLQKAYDEGVREFVAAGGDGTVNLILNGVIRAGLDGRKITLGAVGLGSSNDYHKPFRQKNMVMCTPVKLDFRDAVLCDVLKIGYLDPDGSRKVRFCLCNASIGVTAEANAFFNLKTQWMKVLQRISVEVAIATAALRTIVAFRNLPCVIKVNDKAKEEVLLTNMGVIKNPHFTGSLCYDADILPNDGKMGLYMCLNHSLLERIAVFIALYRHRFNQRPKTRCEAAVNVEVKSNNVFPLEMDGEVVETSEVDFSVIPRKVRCCV